MSEPLLALLKECVLHYSALSTGRAARRALNNL